MSLIFRSILLGCLSAGLASPAPTLAQNKAQSLTQISQDTTTWHRKAGFSYQFRPLSTSRSSARLNHLGNMENWVSVSRIMTEKKGMFTDFSFYIGVTNEGRFEGVIYGSGLTALASEDVAIRQLREITALSVLVEGGETAEVPISDVMTAEVTKNGASEPETIYFRKFAFPQKAYRMMGALPDENRVRFQYVTPKQTLGAFAYHTSSQQPNPWVFSIGYAKELAQLAAQGKVPSGALGGSSDYPNSGVKA